MILISTYVLGRTPLFPTSRWACKNSRSSAKSYHINCKILKLEVLGGYMARRTVPGDVRGRAAGVFNQIVFLYSQNANDMTLDTSALQILALMQVCPCPFSSTLLDYPYNNIHSKSPDAQFTPEELPFLPRFPSLAPSGEITSASRIQLRSLRYHIPMKASRQWSQMHIPRLLLGQHQSRSTWA